MRPVDLQDGISKIPVAERLQQQSHQQPTTNLIANQKNYLQIQKENLDKPTHSKAPDDARVSREKRDREFREGKKKKKNSEPEKKLKHNKNGFIDITA